MHAGRIAFIVMLAAVAALTAGCDKKQYFVDENAKYELVEASDGELKDDVFYVKDGARFSAVHVPEGSLKNTYNGAGDVSEVFWTMKDASLIPTLYEGEFLAYQSAYADIGSVRMDRFRDDGNVPGIFNMAPDQDGYLAFSVKGNTVPGSDASAVLKNAASDSIRIVSADGEKASPDMVDASGVFKSGGKDGEKALTFYAGTAYQSAKLKADVRMYSYFETYDLGEGEQTRKSYLKFEMPKGAKSGYYLIRGAGVFRYCAFRKGEGDTASENMNEPFYESADEQLAVYSQQFSIDVPARTGNLGFRVDYDTGDTVDEENVVCTLSSPDGTAYEMQPEDGTAYVSVKTAIAGTWTVSVYPRDLDVVDVGVDSTSASSAAVMQKKTFRLKKDTSNIRFSVKYKGEGEIWGTVTYEDGSVKDLAQDKTDKELGYTYAFAKKGKYTVEVYHYEDAKAVKFEKGHDESNQEQEIITVED